MKSYANNYITTSSKFIKGLHSASKGKKKKIAFTSMAFSMKMEITSQVSRSRQAVTPSYSQRPEPHYIISTPNQFSSLERLSPFHFCHHKK